MKPFRAATFDEQELDKVRRRNRANGISEAITEAQIAHMRAQRIFRNDRYQVLVTDCTPDLSVSPPEGCGFPPLVWLSIKRIDREPIHDWRELQDIKNALVGPECEAVELYPAESRLTDTANQYHLWCITDPEIRWPFGYRARELASPEEAARNGAKQRAFEPKE